MPFKVNLLMKVITISSWVENRRLRKAETEYSFLELVLVDGGIRETITYGEIV